MKSSKVYLNKEVKVAIIVPALYSSCPLSLFEQCIQYDDAGIVSLEARAGLTWKIDELDIARMLPGDWAVFGVIGQPYALLASERDEPVAINDLGKYRDEERPQFHAFTYPEGEEDSPLLPYAILIEGAQRPLEVINEYVLPERFELVWNHEPGVILSPKHYSHPAKEFWKEDLQFLDAYSEEGCFVV